MTTDAALQVPHRHGIRRVLANASVLLGGRTANALISLGYLAVAARSLGTVEAGILILINAFAQLVSEVVKFDSWQAVLHFGAPALAEDRRDRLHQVARFALLLDVISALAGVAVATVAIFLVGEKLGWGPEHNAGAALYCLTIAVMAPAGATGLLRLLDRFDLITAQAPINSTVRLAGSGLVLLAGPSLGLFLIVWAAGSVAGFLYVTAAAIGELRRRGLAEGVRLRGPLTAGMPKAWRFAWATNLSGSLETAFTHAITVVVGAVLGPGPAALWRIGRQVADALAKPARLLVPALYPELARLHATQGEGAMRRLALQVGLLGGGLGTLLLLVSAFAGGPLLALVMGDGFADAADVMTWQVAAAVIGIWALPLEPMLVSLGRPGDALKVRLVVSVAMLAALVPVVERFGAQGAGAALVVGMSTMGLGMFLMLQRKAGRRVAGSSHEISCVDAPARVKRSP
jgi:O-antigen/teichoic acid export membrane protein